MEILWQFGTALWELTGAMAPYILFGLFFAGVLHELVPGDFIQKHLGHDNVLSVLKATIFGIPLPVCSCGVIPLAAALRKEGASRGAVLSFLISTPITGIDSILATFGMFGWLFTLYRIISSIVIAFAAGVLSNLFTMEEVSQKSEKNLSGMTPVFQTGVSSAGNRPMMFSAQTRQMSKTEGGCDCNGSCKSTPTVKFSLHNALRYGFVTLLGDIAKPLLWGLLIGAAITVAIPEDIGAWLSNYTWLGYLIVIAIAVPMYVCATASLPIAASLVLGGVSLGAAFVFLSAGPATNTVTMGVVKKMLGNRALSIYTSTIVAGSILFGLTIDWFFGSMQIDPRSVVHISEKMGIVAIASSILLWGLILWFIVKPWIVNKPECEGESCCGS
ncbi:SO_0444 family Cu/Zn efflux transporter [Hydrogenimonas urashimensis]|uniref:SO_0444 family Cu/Zn efflux transporter n=1 Tax=Hydrogenimonas urashimensis TaxID=2740515 RepID=UPI001915F324|nr:SO_0444 family Cu/Zn efflux transporter [Hydrogenimonas urashimensis]